MNKIEFTVVVPIYNSEKYLSRCIESIIAQTYTEWELILVNDGSTDRSLEIMQKYKKEDRRIKIISQKNAGPGIARNRGIENANGNFVIFIDSDDYIDQNYFKILEAKCHYNDIVFIDVERVSENGQHLSYEKMSKYMTYDKNRIIRSMMTGKIPWGGVRKVIKRDILIKNKIRFSNLQIGEEALFSFQTLHFATQYGFIDCKPVYFYVERENSQSKYELDDPWGGTFQVIEKYIEEIGEYKKYANTLNALNVISTLISIDRITQKYNGEIRKHKLKKRIITFKKNYKKEYGIDILNLMFKAQIFIPFLKLGIVFPIQVASYIKHKF